MRPAKVMHNSFFPTTVTNAQLVTVLETLPARPNRRKLKGEFGADWRREHGDCDGRGLDRTKSSNRWRSEYVLWSQARRAEGASSKGSVDGLGS